uniref:Probable solanesyl-diphosphate synthase 3, chloroplastic n=1 Tax=Tanacetum cinerariifolium TaxID=118510 RepID=A0A699GEN2_TANCI|nr:probable solanesyl-diphosphate synthase 3, chloroplastic [Tanacetum cinerariifolium]
MTASIWQRLSTPAAASPPPTSCRANGACATPCPIPPLASSTASNWHIRLLKIREQHMFEQFQNRPGHAQAPFLIGPKNLSYGELDSQIALVAARLLTGKLDQQRVLFMVRDDHASIPLLLGCLRAGAIPLLLDPGTAAEQVRHLLAHAQVAGVIADADRVEQWQAAGMTLPAQAIRVAGAQAKGKLLGKLLGKRAPVDLDNWPGLLSAPVPAAAALPPARQHGPAYVVFTSGSTARPKGVEMHWPALLAHSRTIGDHYGLDRSTRLMNLMPLSHADGLVQGVLLAYRLGCALVRPAPFSIVGIEALLIAVYREQVTHLVAAPTALALLQQYGSHLAENFNNGHFQFAVSCSAPLSAAIWTGFTDAFKVKLINTYGLSETGTCGLRQPDARLPRQSRGDRRRSARQLAAHGRPGAARQRRRLLDHGPSQGPDHLRRLQPVAGGHQWCAAASPGRAGSGHRGPAGSDMGGNPGVVRGAASRDRGRQPAADGALRAAPRRPRAAQAHRLQHAAAAHALGQGHHGPVAALAGRDTGGGRRRARSARADFCAGGRPVPGVARHAARQLRPGQHAGLGFAGPHQFRDRPGDPVFGAPEPVRRGAHGNAQRHGLLGLVALYAMTAMQEAGVAAAAHVQRFLADHRNSKRVRVVGLGSSLLWAATPPGRYLDLPDIDWMRITKRGGSIGHLHAVMDMLDHQPPEIVVIDTNLLLPFSPDMFEEEMRYAFTHLAGAAAAPLMVRMGLPNPVARPPSDQETSFPCEVMPPAVIHKQRALLAQQSAAGNVAAMDTALINSLLRLSQRGVHIVILELSRSREFEQALAAAKQPWLQSLKAALPAGPTIRYLTSPIFEDSGLYCDGRHMNAAGARRFAWVTLAAWTGLLLWAVLMCAPRWQRKTVMRTVGLAGVLLAFGAYQFGKASHELDAWLGFAFVSLKVWHLIAEHGGGGMLGDGRAGGTVAYLLFPPTLAVGPVQRYDAFRLELLRARWDRQMASEALQRILYGYVKVVLLAGYLLNHKLQMLDIETGHPWLDAYLPLLGYGLNLYWQFSGYCDIAIGFAGLLGIRVPENFRFPFAAANLPEFWRRWHITVSEWCRDFVFRPILGAPVVETRPMGGDVARQHAMARLQLVPDAAVRHPQLCPDVHPQPGGRVDLHDHAVRTAFHMEITMYAFLLRHLPAPVLVAFDKAENRFDFARRLAHDPARFRAGVVGQPARHRHARLIDARDHGAAAELALYGNHADRQQRLAFGCELLHGARIEHHLSCRMQMVGHPLLARGQVARLRLQLGADRLATGQPFQHIVFAAVGNHRVRARLGGALGGQDLGEHAAAPQAAAGAARHCLQRQVRHQRAERIVVAELDFVGDHRVVLVDDRHDTEAQQGGQRGPGVQVAFAVGQVGVREQHLRRAEAVGAEAGLVDLRQAHLANGRAGLQFVDVVRAALEAEAQHAFGNRARRHQHHLLAQRAQGGDLRRPAGDGGMVEAAAVVGDQRRADLDDDAVAGLVVTKGRRNGKASSADYDYAVEDLEARIVRIDRRNTACFLGHLGFFAALLGMTHLLQVHLDRVDQLLRTVAAQRRDLEHRTLEAEFLDEVLYALGAFRFRHHVELVQYQPARLVHQRFVVLFQLVDQRLGFLDRIDIGLERRQVDDVQQQTGALQMAQELVAEARAFGGAFDQARDVGDHKAFLVRDADHAQVREQGRERVIGNLRTGIRHGRNERRFTGVGHAQQTDVRQHFQLEADFAAFAFLALGLLARCAVGRGLEVDVAPAALAALGQQFHLTVFGQVGQDLARHVVDDQGADRHAHMDIVCALAVAIGATARFAVFRAVHLGKAEIDQGIDVTVRYGPDRATLAAVAAVRAAERAEFFTAKRGATIAAVTTDDFNFCFVDKLHDSEQGVVFAGANAFAGAHWGAALTNDDAACIDRLTACAGTGLAVDRDDLDFGVILTMALMLLVVLTTTHLENLHLIVTTLSHNSNQYRSTFNQGSTKLDAVARANGEDLVNGDLGTNVCRYLFYFEFFASDNFVLFATGFYDRVHDLKPLHMLRKIRRRLAVTRTAVMHGNRGTADYTWDGFSRQKLFTNGRRRGMSVNIGGVPAPPKRFVLSAATHTAPQNTLAQSIAADMDAVNSVIRRKLHSEVSLVNQIAEYIISAGGKRLRPVLVLLMANAYAYKGTAHHELAAVVEFIHTATLLHDDVVDESSLRRGRATANALFGNAASVLVGDFLYSRSFQMMADLANMRVMQILSEATNVIAEGEVLQLLNMHDPDVSQERYLQVIRSKTAKLFEAAAELGALIAGANDVQIAAAGEYGRSLGTAFQLIDDVLDYAGDAAEIGKNVGDDLREGKPTLPLIYLMENGTPEQRELVRTCIEQGDEQHFDAVLAAVTSSGALDFTRRQAEVAAERAADAIADLPDSEYKDSLLQLAHFSVHHLLHQLRRPAQAHALVRDHERPVDQDRMGQHGVQQGRIRQRQIPQTQLPIQIALVAHGLAHRQAGPGNQVFQHRARGRVLDVVDDVRLDARGADRFQGLARRAASGVVINRDGHAAPEALHDRRHLRVLDHGVVVERVLDEHGCRVAVERHAGAEVRRVVRGPVVVGRLRVERALARAHPLHAAHHECTALAEGKVVARVDGRVISWYALDAGAGHGAHHPVVETGIVAQFGFHVAARGAQREPCQRLGLDVELEAARGGVARVGVIGVRARGQVHTLLDVFPFHVKDVGVDRQPVVEEARLAAHLVAPQAVGRIVGRACRQAVELQVRAARGGRHEDVGAAQPKALGHAGVQRVGRIDFPGQRILGSERVRRQAGAAVVAGAGQVVAVALLQRRFRLQVARADGRVHGGGKVITGFAKQRGLPFAVMKFPGKRIVVRERPGQHIGQQFGIVDVEAERFEGVGQAEDRVILGDIGALARIIRAQQPGPGRHGAIIGPGSETEFLRHLAHPVLQVHGRRQAGNRVDQLGRRLAAVVGGRQERGQRIAVVRGTVLGAVELARKIAGGGRQVGAAQVPVDGHAGRQQLVDRRLAHLLLRLVVGPVQVEGGDVLRIEPLEVQRRRDGQRADRFPLERGPQLLVAVAVDVAGHLVAVAVDLVDIAARALGLDADAQGEFVGNQRKIAHHVGGIAGAAAFGAGRLGVGGELALVHSRFVGHELDGAAHRAGAVQRGLRTAQHFHPVDIEKARLDIAHGVDVAHRDRRVAQVHAHRGGAGRGADAADFDIRGAGPGAAVAAGGRKRDIGHHARQVRDVADMFFLQLLAGDGGNTHCHLGRIFLALLRGHGHHFDLVGDRRGRGLRLGAVGPCGQGRHDGTEHDRLPYFHAFSPVTGKGCAPK